MSIPIQHNRANLKPFSQVSHLLGRTQPTHINPPVQPNISTDHFQLQSPSRLFQSNQRVPANSMQLIDLRPIHVSNSQTNHSQSPREQVLDLGRKYGVTYDGTNLKSYQTKVIKAILKIKAREHGIPENIAMGIAGNESGWKMWKDPESGDLIQGRNQRDGKLLSTDWGVMQINDKAHPGAFPRAKIDLEYNIEYGLNYLARQRHKNQGSLGLGFGDWDRSIASYNLGHNPSTERAYAIARNYVSHVKTRSTLS